MKLSLAIALPKNFRRDDFLTFHRRDSKMVAERWDERCLQKGILWSSMPACLSFSFHEDQQLHVELDVDSGRNKIDKVKAGIILQNLVNHMLGLNQATASFEEFALAHPDLKPLVTQKPGLRVPQSASPFEALSWAITGQQISLSAAVSLRRKLITKIGIKHSSGILCYPDAEHIAHLSETDLRGCSYSAAKARTLINLSQTIERGELPLTKWRDDFFQTGQLPAEEIYQQLLSLPGIGPWTIHYALLRGFGWLDGSLHGDVAVRRNLQHLLVTQKKFTEDKKITERQAQEWLASFSPWRALVAAHLWAMQLKDVG